LRAHLLQCCMIASIPISRFFQSICSFNLYHGVFPWNIHPMNPIFCSCKTNLGCQMKIPKKLEAPKAPQRIGRIPHLPQNQRRPCL
jgi:hypothetical protein